MNDCDAKVTRAERLLNELVDERAKWHDTLKQLECDHKNMVHMKFHVTTNNITCKD